MEASSPGATRHVQPPAWDLAALGQDWITLWQSELAAMAADRELAEMSQLLLSLWSAAATTVFAAAGSGPHNDQRPARSAGPAAAAGSPPAAAALDAGGDAVERLQRRVAGLERRLAELDQRGHAATARPRGNRTRRS